MKRVILITLFLSSLVGGWFVVKTFFTKAADNAKTIEMADVILASQHPSGAIAMAPGPQKKRDVKIGVFTPDFPTSLQTLEGSTDIKFDGLLSYIASSEGMESWRPAIAMLDVAKNEGRIAQLGFEMLTIGVSGKNDAAYKLTTITNGNHDADLIRWADYLKSYNYPVILRPLSEMNGNWSAWSGTVNGNSPADYAPAYRHIVDIFRARGATNVKFAWTVNNVSVNAVGLNDSPDNDISLYYPGDAYVDYLGINGYDFGGTESKTFVQVFEKTYNRFKNDDWLDNSKPIIIGETATASTSTIPRETWFSDMLNQVRNVWDIEQVYWFNANKERDWRIETSTYSLEAFKKSYAPEKYTPIWINPYFANYSAIALLNAYQITGNSKYLSAVSRYMNWYIKNINVDGTIYDYEGTWASFASKGTYDSSDSYAATFLVLADKFSNLTRSSNWLKENISYIKKISMGMELTLDKTDNLTWAKPSYKMKYLMDNLEVRLGVLAAKNITSKLKITDPNFNAIYFTGRNQKIIASLNSYYIRAINAYGWAKDESGQKYPYSLNWDTAGKSNSMLLAFGLNKDLYSSRLLRKVSVDFYENKQIADAREDFLLAAAYNKFGLTAQAETLNAKIYSNIKNPNLTGTYNHFRAFYIISSYPSLNKDLFFNGLFTIPSST